MRTNEAKIKRGRIFPWIQYFRFSPSPLKKILDPRLFCTTYREPFITNKFFALAFSWNSSPLMISGSFNHKNKPPCKIEQRLDLKKNPSIVDLLCQDDDGEKQSNTPWAPRNKQGSDFLEVGDRLLAFCPRIIWYSDHNILIHTSYVPCYMDQYACSIVPGNND